MSIDTSKIIHAPVGGGRYTVTAPIVKEDYGLYLKIEGLELPSTYEVDFSNDEHSGTSVTMIGNADGVLIPSQFISTGKDVFAFLYHVGADFGRTIYKFRIPNKLRPDRTDEEPTPEEQSTIDQAISALNTAVAKTAQDVIDADESAQSAAESADRAEQAKDTAGEYANDAETSASNAQTSADNASASATASAQSASQAEQIKAVVEELVEDAQGYAQTASSKASEASQSAQTASTKATEAAQSATNAQTYASNAESAKTDAQTAKTQAESARDDAITAKTGAESARDEAQNLVDGISGKVEQIDANTASIESLEEDRYTPYVVDSASGSIASFSDGADDIPLKSLVVDINPVQDLHGQDAPWPAGGGKNLFNWNRTEGTPNPETTLPPTSPRVMDTEHYFVGITRNNYYATIYVSAYSIANGIISVTTVQGGYGLGFPAEIEENTDYVVSYVNVNNGKVSVGYYDKDWNYISNKDAFSTPYTITVPAGAKYAVFVVTPVTVVAGQNNECTVKDIQVELGSTATAYAPYSNICPISGWTGANVTKAGKNLLPLTVYVGVAYNPTVGATFNTTPHATQWTDNHDGTFTINTSSTWQNYGIIMPIRDGYSYFRQFTFTSSGQGGFTEGYLDSDYKVLSKFNSTTMPTTKSAKLDWNSSPSAKYYYVVFTNRGTASATLTLTNPIVSIGTSAVTYEPYSATTIPISLGQTVYGGTLNPLTGVLTAYPYYASYNGETLTGEWISDRDKYVAGTTPTNGAQVVNIGAEGTEYQLEPHEVKSLLGANNIFADTGNSAVEYRADTRLYISRLTEPDADMIADSNIVSGQYFMVGNNLFKATANIASGSAVIVGTNAIRKSLSEALNEINA